jgi:dCTP deaminase
MTINPSLDDFDPEGLYLREDYSQRDNLGRPRPFKLDPHEFVVAFTLEEVQLPNDLAASIEGRTRLARYGLAVHTTAPHIHPTWRGPIALELQNQGPITIELQPGVDKICQLIFHELKSPVPSKLAKAISTFMGQERAYRRPR